MSTARQAASRRDPAYPIGSVGNALRILLMFRDASAVRVADIARELGIARSTSHRVLAVLQHFEFIVQDKETRAYVRGPALVDVGLAALDHLAVRRAAHIPIRMLRDEIGETVEVCVLDGPMAVVVDVAEGLMPLRVVDTLGDRVSSHLSAAGKAMLAALPEDEVLRLFPTAELERVTESSIGARDKLVEELAQIRTLGYATTVGEAGYEFVGAAAAIVDEVGGLCGAVTVALPRSRASADFAVVLGPQVERTARAVGAML